MKTRLITITALALLVLSTSVSAGGLANARAIGMAGAYTSLARGFYCPSSNPANLALSAGQMNGLQLFGAGVSISNNSYSLDDYNNYTGATLDESDKQDLLNKIPTDGLKVSGDAELTALSFGYNTFAVSLSGLAAAEINLSRDVAELLLDGNTIADTIVLDGMYGEGYGLASINFSYGHRLYKNLDRQLSVGGTYRYLRGFAYEEVIELNGKAVTMATGFEGAGSMVSRTATGGHGHALDLGAAMQISKNYTVGVTVFNFLSVITWNKDTEEHHFAFEFDTVTVANLNGDSLITSTDTTIEVSSFTSHLPSIIRVGLARTTGSLQWAVDWEQGFKKGAGSSSTPRIMTGAEYRALSFLPIRAGFAVGGKQGTTFAGGLGFDFAAIHLDLAAANYNAISGSAGKGLNFAVSGGFRF